MRFLITTEEFPLYGERYVVSEVDADGTERPMCHEPTREAAEMVVAALKIADGE